MSAVLIRMVGLYRYDKYRAHIYKICCKNTFVMGSRTGAYGTMTPHSGLNMDSSDVSHE